MRLLILSILLTLAGCNPKSIKGSGKSISAGTVKNGSLENGRRFPKKG